MLTAAPSETFPALDLPLIRHAFINRIPGLDVTVEREEALRRLDEHHVQARHDLGFGEKPFVTAEQVHGKRVAIFKTSVPFPTAGGPLCADGADGIITNEKNAVLGIYVADCCALYLVDPITGTIGLVHSGKKGTGQGIATVAIETMRDRFACNPAHIVAQLSPCIRPPHYEVDFAAEIVAQCQAAGVKKVFDCGKDTAADLSHYYSYRAEHGKTGRMLALLALD